jgi:hypothetical protein
MVMLPNAIAAETDAISLIIPPLSAMVCSGLFFFVAKIEM